VAFVSQRLFGVVTLLDHPLMEQLDLLLARGVGVGHPVDDRDFATGIRGDPSREERGSDQCRGNDEKEASHWQNSRMAPGTGYSQVIPAIRPVAAGYYPCDMPKSPLGVIHPSSHAASKSTALAKSRSWMHSVTVWMYRVGTARLIARTPPRDRCIAAASVPP